MGDMSLFLIWAVVVMMVQLMFSGVLVVGLIKLVRRNEYLTSLIAVAKAHGGRGTDAARAQVATLKELNKMPDKIAAGVTPPQKNDKAARFKVKAP